MKRSSNLPEESERTRRKDARWETTTVSIQINGVPKRDGKTSSWKRVEDYRLSKPKY
jgi:hypothetical protein